MQGRLDVFPNSVTYSGAISACEKGEQWQQALDLVVAEQSVELLPGVITCNASISAREKREQWQQALGLPGSLVVFPNSVTYSAAITACEKGVQWQQALDLFVAKQSVELLPDVITYNASPGEQLSPPSRGEWTRVEKTRGWRWTSTLYAIICGALPSTFVNGVQNGRNHYASWHRHETPGCSNMPSLTYVVGTDEVQRML